YLKHNCCLKFIYLLQIKYIKNDTKNFYFFLNHKNAEYAVIYTSRKISLSIQVYYFLFNKPVYERNFIYYSAVSCNSCNHYKYKRNNCKQSHHQYSHSQNNESDYRFESKNKSKHQNHS